MIANSWLQASYCRWHTVWRRGVEIGRRHKRTYAIREIIKYLVSILACAHCAFSFFIFFLRSVILELLTLKCYRTVNHPYGWCGQAASLGLHNFKTTVQDGYKTSAPRTTKRSEQQEYERPCHCELLEFAIAVYPKKKKNLLPTFWFASVDREETPALTSSMAARRTESTKSSILHRLFVWHARRKKSIWKVQEVCATLAFIVIVMYTKARKREAEKQTKCSVQESRRAGG